MKKRLLLAMAFTALLALLCGAALADRSQPNEYYVVVGLYDLSSDGAYDSCDNGTGYLVMPIREQNGHILQDDYWLAKVGYGDWDAEDVERWYKDQYIGDPGGFNTEFFSSDELMGLKATMGFPTELMCVYRAAPVKEDFIKNRNDTYTSKIRFVVQISTDRVHWTTIGDWTEKTSAGGRWSDDKIIDSSYYPFAYRVDEIEGAAEIQIPLPGQAAKTVQYEAILADQYGAEWYQRNAGQIFFLLDEPDGVSIDQDGVLTVTSAVLNNASAPNDITFQVGATGLNNKMCKKTVTLRMPRFTVTYKNYDGSQLRQFTNVKYNTVWTDQAVDAARQPDSAGHYEFSGWQGYTSGMKILGNTTFTANYTRGDHQWTLNAAHSMRTCDICGYSEPLTNQQVYVTPATTAWEAHNTYIVTQDVTITERVLVGGEATLQLGEGATLTCAQGIGVPAGARLIIQGSGTLIADASDVQYAAGIGGTSYGSSAPCGIIVINGGTITAKGGYYGAGIGAGIYGFADAVEIHGGKVTAIGGQSAFDIACTNYGGAQRVVLGWTNKDDYISAGTFKANSIIFEDEFHYSLGGVDVGPANGDNIRGKDSNLTLVPWITPLDNGFGREDAPWLIQSAADWNRLSEAVNLGMTYSGYYFQLTQDIAVSAMTGTASSPFGGSFDGGRHTLTLNATASEQYAAPFRYVSGASFAHLRVTGAITTSAGDAGGFVGRAEGACTITDCVSDIHITALSSGAHAGFVANCASDDNVSVTGSLFTGSISGARANYCAGFLGYNGWKVDDCVYAGDLATDGGNSNTFIRTKSYANNCYYLNLNGIERVKGSQALKVSPAADVSINYGRPKATYFTSGIVAYETGLYYGANFYAGPNQNVRLTLTALPDEGMQAYSFTASAGTLTRSGSAWNLKLANADAVISAHYAPLFGVADFKIPAFMTAIEAEAFENIAATAVEVPANCAAIGDHAFRACRNLQRIRIPANCALGDGVFDGCATVYVYSAAGSLAESYCALNPNCVFVTED